LDIDSIKLLATAYTAFEGTEEQKRSDPDQDGGTLVLTIKPVDH